MFWSFLNGKFLDGWIHSYTCRYIFFLFILSDWVYFFKEKTDLTLTQWIPSPPSHKSLWLIIARKEFGVNIMKVLCSLNINLYCVADFEEQPPATSKKCLQDIWQMLGVRFPRMSWAFLRLILAKSSSLEGCPFSSLSRGHLEETHTLFPLHKFCEILSLLSQEMSSIVQVSSNYYEDSPWSLVEDFEGPSSHCNINKRSNLVVELGLSPMVSYLPI